MANKVFNNQKNSSNSIVLCAYMELEKEIQIIENSGYFDKEWYLEKYSIDGSGNPIVHYIQKGSKMGYNPSLRFETKYYINQYSDVANSQINPLIHFLLFGKSEGRSPRKHKVFRNDTTFNVDVIVPVYNAFEDVKKCLNSLLSANSGVNLTVIIVNDCSDKETSDLLKRFSKSHSHFILIENEENLGYTKTVNKGLQASRADFVVTLNSDTIVSKGWLTGLLRCISFHPNIGIVGPLSNAASWQTIPKIFDEDGKFFVNELPPDYTIKRMNELFETLYNNELPIVPLVNGFCYAIKRDLLETIGYLDEVNFPVGYGEEDDFSIRAFKAGFFSTLALDTYVFHSKSKSFTPEGRKPLAQKGKAKLIEKYRKPFLSSVVDLMKNQAQLKLNRERVEEFLD